MPGPLPTPMGYINGGQEEIKKVGTEGKKDGGTDSRQRGKGGRKGDILRFLLRPPRAFPWTVGRKCHRTAESGQHSRPQPPDAVTTSAPDPSPSACWSGSVPGAVPQETPGIRSLSPAGLSPGAAPGRRTHCRPRSSVRVPRSLGTCPGLVALWGPCQQLGF